MKLFGKQRHLRTPPRPLSAEPEELPGTPPRSPPPPDIVDRDPLPLGHRARRGLTAPALVLGAANLSAELVTAWKLDHGHRSHFDGPLASGAQSQTEGSAQSCPISWLMADLWRITSMPPVDKKWPGSFIAQAGLRRDGRMAATLERMMLTPAMDFRRLAQIPPRALARYVIAEILSEATTGRGRFDLGRLKALFGSHDAEKLVRWIGEQPRGPMLKQYEHDPWDLWTLEPDERHHDLPIGARIDGCFGNLIASITVEEAHRRRVNPMPVVGKTIEHCAERGWTKHPDDFIFDEEHIVTSSITPQIADRFWRAGKGYSTAVPVVIHDSQMHGQVGTAPHFLNVEELAGDAVFNGNALRLYRDDLQPNVIETALFKEGLSQGQKRPFHNLQVISSGARALTHFAEYVQACQAEEEHDPATAPGETISFKKSESWWGFGDRATFMNSISGVEHTRDGARKLHKLGLEFPVVNAAESPVKLKLAAVLLAWGIVDELLRSLDERGLKAKKILVVGYGSMGSNVAALLHSLGYEVTIKDSDAAAREKAQAVADRGELAAVIDRVPPGFQTDVVIGAVGMPSLDPQELANFESGAIFASASSSNKEFPFRRSAGWKIPAWDTFDLDKPEQTFKGQTFVSGRPGFDYSNYDWVIKNGANKEHLVLNSGYAVNMNKAPYSLGPDYVQVIRAVIALASLQARHLPAGTKGLVDLDVEGQRFIAEDFMARVRSNEVSLPAVIREHLERGYQETIAELDAMALHEKKNQ